MIFKKSCHIGVSGVSTKLQQDEKEVKSKTLLVSEYLLRQQAESTPQAGEAHGWEAHAAARQRDLEGLQKE